MNKKRIGIVVGIFGFVLLLFLIPGLVDKGSKPDSGDSNSSSEATLQQVSVRKAAVSGQFYPKDQDELKETITGYLLSAAKQNSEIKPRILFAPHAGLEFSGKTAAYAYKQIEGHQYSRVIILSGNHHHKSKKAAVYDQGSWETPLGAVDVDETIGLMLIDEEKSIISNPTMFTQDHTIEMEILFLQSVLNDFKIVPILLGQVDESVIEALAQKLYEIMDENTLIVVSTDLSHYPTWEVANQVDHQTINAIVGGSRETYLNSVEHLTQEYASQIDTHACGTKAVEVALQTAELLEISDFELIVYSNSGDITGDHSRVVGYAAIVASKDHLPGSFLNESAKKEALAIARETLESYLTGGGTPQFSPHSRYLYFPLGAFVTLENGDQLRGCIGHFEPAIPLHRVIQQAAIDAATKDHRFKNVTSSEMNEIEIEVSIMTPRRKIDSWEEIELGKHGVVVQKSKISGTFLPQVATDTGWSKEEFLKELCSQKAGLARNCYQDPSVALYVFEAQIFADYEVSGSHI